MKKKLSNNIKVFVTTHLITKLLLAVLPILGPSPLSSIIIYLFVRYLVHYFMD